MFQGLGAWILLLLFLVVISFQEGRMSKARKQSGQGSRPLLLHGSFPSACFSHLMSPNNTA